MDFGEDENTDTIKKRIASTSHTWKISVVLFIIGFLFHIISFGTPFWIVVKGVSNSTYVGIWNSCSSISSCDLRTDNADCITTVRVFQSLATLGGIIVLIHIYMYVHSSESRSCKGVSAAVLCFITALCIQIGTGVFGRSRGCHATTSPQDEIAWSWSLALSLTSVVLLCVVVFLFLLEELRGCRNKAKQQKGKGNNLRMTIT